VAKRVKRGKVAVSDNPFYAPIGRMMDKDLGEQITAWRYPMQTIKFVAVFLPLVLVIASCGRGRTAPPPLLSRCDLSRDFGAHRDKLIAVRGVYYDGLRAPCPGTPG
jgi:hypothetical protein